MLTRNFYKGTVAWLTSSYTTGCKNRNGGTTSIEASTVTDTTSGIKPAMLNPTGYYDTAAYGVFFGSGTTPPTVDDYKMESVITTGTSFIKPSAVSVNETYDYCELSVTYGISASTDQTISEVGLFVTTQRNTDLSKSVMLDHTVLETPITIPAGQSKQITYTIRMNYPTA